jgi:hypothetical protein
MLVHTASLAAYLVILILAADTGRLAQSAGQLSIRRWGVAFSVAVISMCCFFIPTQLIYAVKADPFDLGSALDLIWLLYDWTNALAYLAFLLGLRVYIKMGGEPWRASKAR